MDLHVFWFLMLGALLAGYAILDGFDLGVGTLHLVLARTDQERRVLLNAIGPVWDGNEVWLVTFGGALFAAFPNAYAAAFSGFYLPLMLLLVGLIFRAVAIEFRSKREARVWRQGWDIAFFMASALSALILGTAVGAVFHGLPLREGRFEGGLVEQLGPFSLLVGVFTVALFALHGAVYLVGKTEGALHQRVRTAVWTCAGLVFVLYAFTTIFALTTVPQATANFGRFPWAWALVVVNVLALGNIPRAIFRGRDRQAFLSSAVTIACLVGLFGLAQYPNLLSSSIGAEHALTIYNASSSERTLQIMQVVAFLGLPFVFTYTAVIYWVFRGKVRVGKHSY